MDPMSYEGIVILGGGLAAVRTAQGLRTLGYTDPIRLYSEELCPPYDRPPLSKDYLTGAIDDEGLQLLSPQAVESLGLDIRLGARAVRLDRGSRLVEFVDGSRSAYDRLVVATGARARLLPGLTPSDRIHYLRTVDDARALARALAGAKRLVVVGSGFIGLEVASSARQLGIDVEVVAADAGPMIGVVGGQLSRWLTKLHRANGVMVTNSVTIADVDEGLFGVSLITSDNVVRRGDVALVGAGVIRDLNWLAMAGLTTDRGLVCDIDGRTNDPNIFGVGDIVCKQGQSGREPIGHWTAAADSARRAAHALAGAQPPNDAGDGFFWTEQHGHRLQFVGTATVDADLQVCHGSLGEGKFVAELIAPGSGAVTGVFASNSPRDFLKRRLAFQKAVPVGVERGLAS
jgi:3-phenylpropionate/trans-cinnamate dioxygenase ferredoxin reductase subunit